MPDLMPVAAVVRRLSRFRDQLRDFAVALEYAGYEDVAEAVHTIADTVTEMENDIRRAVG